MSHPAFSPDNVAVITGAALGIGRAMAKRFAEAGMKVALLDVNEKYLAEAAAEIGGAALPVICDVSDVSSLQAARGKIMEHWGKAPSVLVNNAVTRMAEGFDAPLEDWKRSLDINVMGVVNGVHVFLDDMKTAGTPALIINLGSKQGITNPPGHPVYNMAKAAVRTYSEALEHELRQNRKRNVMVHMLVPGWTTTGFDEHRQGAWHPDQVVDYMLAAIDRGSFYIVCPDDEVSEELDRKRFLWTAMDITEDRMPLSRWHDYGRKLFEAFSKAK
jgi:NAD(P)-dependent dehydrogenase (short-subunit alcohol dehydrogenase family)